MKVIECPFKLASPLLAKPEVSFFAPRKSTTLLWTRIYGHVMFGLTQEDP